LKILQCILRPLTSISLLVCIPTAYTAPSQSWSVAVLPAGQPQHMCFRLAVDIFECETAVGQGLIACMSPGTAKSASMRRYACVQRSLPDKSPRRQQQARIRIEALHSNAVDSTCFLALQGHDNVAFWFHSNAFGHGVLQFGNLRNSQSIFIRDLDTLHAQSEQRHKDNECN